MSEDKQLVVARATGSKNLAAMFKKVKGLDEDSPLRKMQGQGALRLTVDGNQFQIKKGSKVIQTIKDFDNLKKPAKELDVVIHMVSPVIQKQAALKYDPRNPSFDPIGCWSNDGNNPDADVWNKQSHSCDTCKFGKGAEAKDSMSGKMASCGLTRLAVVSIYNPDTAPEDIELMLMNFNYSSNKRKNNRGEDPEENLFGMLNYLEMLAGMEVDTYKVITRLVVDDWSDPKNNCKLLFKPIDVIDEGQPNYDAHMLWKADESKDLEAMVKITQRKPEDVATMDEDGGASEEEAEEEATPAKRTKKKVAKKKAAKKKAAKKVVEEDLENLEDIGEEEELPEEEEPEELVEESEDDFGDLEDLL